MLNKPWGGGQAKKKVTQIPKERKKWSTSGCPQSHRERPAKRGKNVGGKHEGHAQGGVLETLTETMYRPGTRGKRLGGLSSRGAEQLRGATPEPQKELTAPTRT